MKLFRLLIGVLLVIILIYTFQVISVEGADFFTPYFQAIAGWNWQGQFNIDFGMYLLFSTLWIMRRHHFNSRGIIIGLACSVGGMIIFLPYLLVASWKARNFEELLIGNAQD